MPNWCENKLTIDGKNAIDLHVFAELFLTLKDDNSYTFDFKKVIPEPTTIDKCPKKYRCKGNDHIVVYEDRSWFNWYEWHCDKWGTKWNASDVSVHVDFENCNITIYFDTAWSPCVPVIEKLFSKCKRSLRSLHIEYAYYEPGMGFAGFMDTDGSDTYLDCTDDEFRQFTIDAGFETEEYWEWLDSEGK